MTTYTAVVKDTSIVSTIGDHVKATCGHKHRTVEAADRCLEKWSGTTWYRDASIYADINPKDELVDSSREVGL